MTEPNRSMVEAAYADLRQRCTDAVVTVVDGRIRSANPAWCRLTRMTTARCVEKPLVDFFDPGDAGALGGLAAAQVAGRPLSVEARLKPGAGPPLAVRVEAVGLASAPPGAHQLVVRDLSDEKRVEKTRHLESLAALSGGIAHDYNNLLTAILGNISLTRTRLDPGHEVQRLLAEALEASLLAKDLTAKLITFAKGGAPVKEATAVAPLVRSAADFALSGSNVRPVYRFAGDLRDAEMDPAQIGQAIHNIVINAREAMPRGGTVAIGAENLSVRDETTGLAPGEHVVISVCDQGAGIAPEHLDAVFDPYFSTKPMGRDRGMGLGLSICHSIVTRHGGMVAVAPAPGGGTAVRIVLPAAARPASPITAPETPEEAVPLTGTGKILVMDDDPLVREIAGSMLTQLGYTAAFAQDGAEALEGYARAMDQGAPFDAVVLDLTVRGGMGGREAVRALARIDPRVRAVVSSGYANDPVMADFRSAGFCGTMAKPYTLYEMSRTLHEVLGAKSAE